MKWKTIRKILPIIGIGIFIYLLIRLDITQILKEINNLNVFFLPIIFILVIIFLIIQPLKWFVIARKQNIKISFLEAFKINLISNFYGFVTPGKLGAVIRADYLKKKGGNIGKGLGNFIIDKVLDLFSLFVIAIGLGFLFYGKIIPSSYLFLFLIIFGGIIIISLIFCKKENSKKILRFVYRKFIPKRLKEKSKVLFDSFYENFPPLSSFIFYFILNLVVWISNYFIIYLIGLSLGIDMSFVPFLAILAISTLVAQIPITINGFGTRELTLIGLFSLFSISAVKVFSMSILSIIIITIIPSLIAIYLLFGDKTLK